LQDREKGRKWWGGGFGVGGGQLTVTLAILRSNVQGNSSSDSGLVSGDTRVASCLRDGRTAVLLAQVLEGLKTACDAVPQSWPGDKMDSSVHERRSCGPQGRGFHDCKSRG
jgi:hypothetical protein